MDSEPLIPKHGGYRKLKSFQIAQLCYDVTVRFCDRYVDARSRTRDQMTQAARSGVQNIAEGSQASGTSRRTELKLTGVARSSLEELKRDYEDYLRQHGLPLWPEDDPRRSDLVARRCRSADELAAWIGEVHARATGKPSWSEIAANAALVLIGVACSLLDRQIRAQSAAFNAHGGFTERLYRTRTAAKRRPP